MLKSALTDLPSWLQAFAAIVALGIAVWGTLRADKAVRRREQLQARCIATAIFPDILDMDASLNRARNILSQLASTTSPVGQSLAASIPGARIEVPPMLMRNLDNLYLLKEPTGPTCLQLITVSLQYNSLVDSVAAQVAAMGKNEGVSLLTSLGGHLTAIEILLKAAHEEIPRMHDLRKFPS